MSRIKLLIGQHISHCYFLGMCMSGLYHRLIGIFLICTPGKLTHTTKFRTFTHYSYFIVCSHMGSSENRDQTTTGYFCPQCRSKYCELPCECSTCGELPCECSTCGQSRHLLSKTGFRHRKRLVITVPSEIPFWRKQCRELSFCSNSCYMYLSLQR